MTPASSTLPLRQRLLAPLAKWYARRELPRYGHLLNSFGMNDQPLWSDAPAVITKDRFFGYRMKLDLSDFFQRIGYFFGCYHELEILAVLTKGLRPGDHVLDGGANIGLVTLYAAGKVGPTGHVDSFEPMPVVFERLRWHVEANQLTWVTIHKAGLSNQPGELELRLPGFDNKAAATFGDIPQRYAHHFESYGKVPIHVGDQFVASQTAPLLIKLDVEGFETKALGGLDHTLRNRLPAVVLEVNGEMLELNHTGPTQIYDVLQAYGHKPFAIDRGGFRARHRLWLHPLTREQMALEKDVLFLHPQGPHWSRFADCMQKPGNYWRHLGVAAGTR